MATASVTKNSVTFYTINCNASVSNDGDYSTTATVSWSSSIKFGDWYYYGVGLKTYVNGTLVKDATGYTTSSYGTCCSNSSTKKITKTTTTQTITVKASSYSTTVSGYGGVGSTTTASLTVTIPALSTFTISYNANGGSGAPSSQSGYYSKTITLSSTVPTRSGYTFAGWATSSTATSATYAKGATYTVSGPQTLYAVWTANSTCTIAFNANGGSGAPSSVTHIINTTTVLPTTKPTRTDYYFLGWSTSSSATSATYLAGGNYTNNSFTNGTTITLYAVWKRLRQLWVQVPDGSTPSAVYVQVPSGSTVSGIYFQTT